MHGFTLIADIAPVTGPAAEPEPGRDETPTTPPVTPPPRELRRSPRVKSSSVVVDTRGLCVFVFCQFISYYPTHCLTCILVVLSIVLGHLREIVPEPEEEEEDYEDEEGNEEEEEEDYEMGEDYEEEEEEEEEYEEERKKKEEAAAELLKLYAVEDDRRRSPRCMQTITHYTFTHFSQTFPLLLTFHCSEATRVTSSSCSSSSSDRFPCSCPPIHKRYVYIPYFHN